MLQLDVGQLGVDPALLEQVPALDQAILRLLPRLDEPAPPMTGSDPQARQALAVAQQS